MNKIAPSVVKIFISFYLLMIIYFNIDNYAINFTKFSAVSFIYNLKLKYIYFLIIFLQLIAAIFIWFNHIKIINKIVSIALYINTFFLLIYFCYFKLIYKGCIDCNFLFKILNESLNITILINSLIFLIYFLFNKQLTNKIN